MQRVLCRVSTTTQAYEAQRCYRFRPCERLPAARRTPDRQRCPPREQRVHSEEIQEDFEGSHRPLPAPRRLLDGSSDSAPLRPLIGLPRQQPHLYRVRGRAVLERDLNLVSET